MKSIESECFECRIAFVARFCFNGPVCKYNWKMRKKLPSPREKCPFHQVFTVYFRSFWHSCALLFIDFNILFEPLQILFSQRVQIELFTEMVQNNLFSLLILFQGHSMFFKFSSKAEQLKLWLFGVLSILIYLFVK